MIANTGMHRAPMTVRNAVNSSSRPSHVEPTTEIAPRIRAVGRNLKRRDGVMLTTDATIPYTTIVLVAMTDKKTAIASGEPNAPTMTVGSKAIALPPPSTTYAMAVAPRLIVTTVETT